MTMNDFKSMSFSTVNMNITWIRHCLVALMLFFKPFLRSNKQNNAADTSSVISVEEKESLSDQSRSASLCEHYYFKYWREKHSPFFFLSHSRPFLYKWSMWSEWRLQVFKSDHTQRFILPPSIFTLINWGCYDCIKIDEVNLSESSSLRFSFALSE